MPRYARMLVPDTKSVYNVISRTALPGFPFWEIEKDEFVRIIKQFSRIYFTDVLGYVVMSNHFHLVVRIYPDHYYSDDDIKVHFKLHYGDEADFAPSMIKDLRKNGPACPGTSVRSNRPFLGISTKATIGGAHSGRSGLKA